ncbi:pectin acetylesterase 8-like [Salvia miltiorrhiza]|uniref:pectin acetylesterase 8-like n=1 Tax=Salvia miltiorrhiza TaxID=226208 RepID=UPI0025AC0195|nr:pectin acetylesterase 8-like [Salvia miltiorrhiza]
MARGSLLASLLIAQLIILNCEGININEVPFTSVADAIPERAVCIDGSPAGYHHDLGFGDGVNNWIIYLMGGGWCNNYLTCQQRRKSPLGSTKNIKPTNFGGILSPNRGINPDFFNWNRVHVHYCDGSSFIGDTAVIHLGPHLQLRGSRIFRAITNELLEKGMKNAKNALLVGGSAGGLSAILNCDNFRANLGNVSRVKCVSDAGFFIRAKNVPYAGKRERRFNSVVRFHNLASFLPKLCTSRMRSGLCLFPENLVEDIQTPLFLINSVFDRVQITRNLKPRELRDIKGWKNCTKDLSKCTHPQRKLIKDFGKAFHETLMNIGDNPSRGLFIHACYAHTYMESNEFWNSSGSPKLGNKTISHAVGDWYFDRRVVKLIDTNTDFPFNCLAYD